MAKKPKLKARKLPPCGPVDVPAVWKRIEAAVGALAPDLLGNLAPGCTDKHLLAHCRTPGEHGCGCWAVNLLLGTAPEFVAPE